MKKCSICGEKFDVEYEGTEIDHTFFCGDCRYEYTFWCAYCGDEELEEKRGDIGTLLIVNDEQGDEPGISDGIYEIMRHPYYGGPITGGMEIFEDAIRRVGDIPNGMEFNMGGYPCAHLCRWCDSVIKRKALLFRKF